MRPNKHKHQGLEQTKVYFRVSSKKKPDGSCSKDPNSRMVFRKVFKGKIWEEGYRVCDFLLVD